MNPWWIRIGAFALVSSASVSTAAPRAVVAERWLQQLQQAEADTGDAAERALYLELESWSGASLNAADRALLARLSQFPARATESHPEVSAMRVPTWPIAQRAAGLLREDAWQQAGSESTALLHDPAGWLEGLRDSAEPAAWLAPLAAPERPLPGALRQALRDCAHADRWCAQALLSRGGTLSPEEFLSAAPHAPADQLVRVVASLDAALPAQRVLLEQALTWPATAAHARQKLAAAGAVDETTLAALAHAEQGAAIAAALAQRLDAALLQRLSERYANSQNVLEQQRLLLVLRLNEGPQAQQALRRWLDSPGTLAATRQAVQSW